MANMILCLGDNIFVQEFNDLGQHRIVNKTTKMQTIWTPYQEIAYIDNCVSITDYYTGCGEKLLSANEAWQYIAYNIHPITV